MVIVLEVVLGDGTGDGTGGRGRGRGGCVRGGTR